MEKSFDKIPEHLKPKDVGSDSLFNNSWFEWLTRAHIAIPVTMHTIVLGIVSYYALTFIPMLTFISIFIAGWVTWTCTEYWVHRYVYHVHTVKKWMLNIQHFGHGIHHQYPKDVTRLAMPPIPALLFSCTFFSIFWLFMQNYAFAFFPGFVFGYVLYISLHYAFHRYKAPKFKPLKTLWKFHALHHYKYPETKGFGVSTRLWDYMFGTLPDN